jgi:multicomponent Na+:H+ antiporter subunit D
MPVVAGAFVLGGLGLIGVPGTAGFISKWYLVLAALDAGAWYIAVAVLLSSMLAIAYVWRVVEIFYFREPPEQAEPGEQAADPAHAGQTPHPGVTVPWAVAAAACAMIAATVYFGFSTQLPVDVAQAAAEQLAGGRP